MQNLSKYLLYFLLLFTVTHVSGQTPCGLTAQHVLFDSIQIENEPAPFEVTTQSIYDLRIYLNGASYNGPYFIKAWIDTDADAIFEPSELILNHGPSNSLTIQEAIALPGLITNQQYALRFAISQDANFGPCDSSIEDFLDTFIKKNDPFTVSANDTSCPCGYNPQNGALPLCTDLGQRFTGQILYKIPKRLLPPHTEGVKLVVTAYDPYKNPIHVQSQAGNNELIIERSIDANQSYPLRLSVPVDLLSFSTNQPQLTNKYSIYLELYVKTKAEESQNDDIDTPGPSYTPIYSWLAEQEVFIPLCHDGSEEHMTFTPYPNPVKDRLYITNEELTTKPFQLFDKSGLLIEEGTTDQVFIEMAERGAGIYVLAIGTEKHILFKQ